jgi:hypothetical protein
MAKIMVTFRGLDQDGNDSSQGYVIWDGAKFTFDPPQSKDLLEHVAMIPDGHGGYSKTIRAMDDPIEWLKALHNEFRSAYSYATKPIRLPTDDEIMGRKPYDPRKLED